MRILFDSWNPIYKQPFGTLTEGEACRLNLDIPLQVGAKAANVILQDGNGMQIDAVSLAASEIIGDYQRFSGSFSMPVGLYFYYFLIEKPDASFRLFRQGRDTNMEAGDCWQVSWICADAQVPQWARGATIYQIFPDRFYRAGTCDLDGKLLPYTLHRHWNELPDWRPNFQGEITNSDFFGGNLRGILEKLPYLRSLGVSMLYLNPIFFAWSNHRYDTADYRKIDPMLGTEADFCALCEAAHAQNMHVILDGVFSHTGNRAPYFQSACSNPDSPYRSWYQFTHWPDRYTSWWGIDTLPCLNKHADGYLDFLIRDPDGVVTHWLKAGADGWRLDVADELPDEFIAMLKAKIRQVKPDALLLGEVWEDASNKIAYGVRRRYFLGKELDAVMNYPLKNAIVSYCMGRDDGSALADTVLTLLDHYPRQVLDCCMSLLSTHDTPRILTELGGGGHGSREEEASAKLSPEERKRALARLRLASTLQFTLPGSPTIYYADETGMEGGKDPFNRKTYPWGLEDPLLLQHYRALGRLRRQEAALRTGQFSLLEAGGGKFAFRRDQLAIYCNLSQEPWYLGSGTLLFGYSLNYLAGEYTLLPGGCAILTPEVP